MESECVFHDREDHDWPFKLHWQTTEKEEETAKTAPNVNMVRSFLYKQQIWFQMGKKIKLRSIESEKFKPAE